MIFFLPEGDAISASRQELESQISYAVRSSGGKRSSTGRNMLYRCVHDIKLVTNLARNMVTQWGFSEKLGPPLYAEAR